MPDFLRYRIYRGTSPNPTTKVDSTQTGGANSIADTTKTLTGLSNGTKYYFRITAVDQNHNESSFLNEVSATPAASILGPAAPKNLRATVGDRQITLKWDANIELDLLRYRIYGGTSPEPTKAIDSVVTVLGVLGTTKTLTGLTNGTIYYYRITAVNLLLKESGFSNEVSATPTSPAAPSSLTATALGNNSVSVTWTDNSDTETGFAVDYSASSTFSSGVTTVSYPANAATAPSTVTKTITGLSASTTYYFRVRATGTTNSNYSATASATTGPPAPTTLSATAISGMQINLSWADNSTTENDFQIDRATNNTFTAGLVTSTVSSAAPPNTTGTINLSVTGLSTSTTYYFRVRARTGTDNSDYSGTASATTTPAADPTALLTTPISSTQITLTFNDNSVNETSFEIERKTGVSGTYMVIAALTVPGDVSTGPEAIITDTGLTPSTAYYYRVRAVVNTVVPISYSQYSNEHSSTTLPVIPNAPINLVATAMSNSQILLSWNATGVTSEDGFKIYRSTSPSVAIIAGNLVGSVGTDIETFTDTGLLSSTTYYYKVVAFNVSGNSSPTNEASATSAGDKTPPALGAVSYAQKVNLNTETPVSLNITDLSGIKNATLYYRSGGAATFSSRAMSLQNGSTYTQTIPAAAVTNRGVEFYVAAEDGAGNLSQSPSYPIQVYCPNGIANPNAQPSGKDAGAYRIFSIPLDLDNKSPAAFLNANSTLGAYDSTKYRWYGFERSTQLLREYPNFGSMTMTPDMGFALLVSLQNLKLKTGSGTTAITTKLYNIALPAGWSLIGNPFNYNIPFDSLRVSAGTFELWSFEGDWQINTRGLEPWKGYAIWLSQAATFSIRPGLAGLKSTTSFYSVENNDAKNWLIQITAENGRSASRFNFAGQNEMAKDDEDQFDLHQPLRLADGVELVFNRQLTTDIRQSSASGHTWELTCVLNPADEMLSLAFDGIQSIPSSFEVFLIDRETQTAYDLRRNQRLQFATRHLTEKNFRLIAGTRTYLNTQTHETEFYPSRYELLQNFPNPFNPTTQIIYSLPEASHVEVSVYNVRGEAVATLVNEEQESGSHTVVWNATEVGSGVYLIRIRAGRFESMKKCLFVK